MTTIPKPQDLGNSYTAAYDAWNRLISLDDGSNTYSYAYDGLHRRIQKNDGSTTTGYYYNQQWQCLAETEGTGGGETAEVLYMWHPQYIDALAVRQRADEDDAHFFTHDANFNVTAAMEDTSGDPVVERYAYTPYGVCVVLDADFSEDADNASDIDNEHLYTGRRTDPETGLQLNRYRYYHQQLGRWVNRDPSGRVDLPHQGNPEDALLLARYFQNNRASSRFSPWDSTEAVVSDPVYESGYNDGFNLYASYYSMWGGGDPYGLGFWDWWYGNGWFNQRGRDLDKKLKDHQIKCGLCGDPFDFARDFRRIQMIGADQACKDIQDQCDTYKEFIVTASSSACCITGDAGWKSVSCHVDKRLRKSGRRSKGFSVQCKQVNECTGETRTVHMVVDGDGNVVDGPHPRPFFKPEPPDLP